MASTLKEWLDAEALARKAGIDLSSVKGQDPAKLLRKAHESIEATGPLHKAFMQELAEVKKIAGKYQDLIGKMYLEHKKVPSKAEAAKRLAETCDMHLWWAGRPWGAKPPTATGWRAAKDVAKKAGLDVSVFKDSYASTLEGALKKGDKLRTARKDCIAALEALADCASKYRAAARKAGDKSPRGGLVDRLTRDLAGVCSEFEEWALMRKRDVLGDGL